MQKISSSARHNGEISPLVNHENAQALTEFDGVASGWKTYNFEVENHHTYIADGVRVHNTSITYTLDVNGALATVTDTYGNTIDLDGSFTPGQFEHYATITENADGTFTASGSLGGFFRALADAIGLDGEFGYQGTFADPNNPGIFSIPGVTDVHPEDETNSGLFGGSGGLFGDFDGDGTPNVFDFDDGVGIFEDNGGSGSGLEWTGGTSTGPGGIGPSDEGTNEWSTHDDRPIVLDLDGDGVEISVDAQTFFDWDDDGFLEQGAWVSADDGFLVIDLNADGTRGDGDDVIDQAHELVWSLWDENANTDLEALRLAFDDNDDGFIDSEDDVWSELRIWRDINQDGITDDGELLTLAEWGITQINLGYDDGSDYSETSDDITVFGNTLHGLASFLHDGSNDELAGVGEAVLDENGDPIVDENGNTIYTVEGGVGDVSLSYNSFGWRRVETDHGYNIEFETGETLRYATITSGTAKDVNLADLNIDGATGDDRNNWLVATGHIASVAISGGAGNDLIRGGWAADYLSGDDGADNIVGGEGNDVIFFDADDVVVRGDGGTDTAILVEYDEVDEDGNVIAAAQGVAFDMQTNGFEIAQGGDGDDHFFVGAGYGIAISVNAGAGDDTINGGGEGDVLGGGDGNDLITGGAGDDVLTGGDGDDTIDGGDGDDGLFGGAGNDSLSAGSGDDQVIGGDGNDTVDGDQGDDFIIGGEGNDSILGGLDDDHLQGDAGNDTLDGGVGDDFLSGGDGNDLIYAGDGDDHVDGGAGSDTIHIGRFGDNVIAAGEGNDHIYASNFAGRNTIFGGTGQDRLYLDGLQSDFDFTQMIYGQMGINQWLVTGPQNLNLHIQDIEVIVFSDGSEFWLDGRNAATDNSESFYDIYEFWGTLHDGSHFSDLNGNLDALVGGFVGGSAWNSNLGGGNDFVWGDGSEADISGGTGDDTITTGTEGDTVVGDTGDDSLDTGEGDDSVDGGSGNDTILGGAGDDALEGGSGSDTLFGGDFEDTLRGGSGADILIGGNGFDEIYGGDGSDAIYGGNQRDTLSGENGSDLISGEAGDDRIFGGHGSDRLYGGTGHDRLYGGLGNDQMYGGDDNDSLYGENGNDQLYGGDGHDSLHGGWGNDFIDGGAQADNLNGHIGDDYLFGGDGDDILNGGAGTDYLEGGAGADVINGGNHPTDMAGYTASNEGVWVDLQNGIATGGHATGDTILNIEALSGSRYADTLAGDSLANVLLGGAGDDFIQGRDGNDRLNGGVGSDTIEGGAGNDVILGDDGTALSGFYYEYRTLTGGSLAGLAAADTAGDGFTNGFNVTGIDAGYDGTGDHFGLILHGSLDIETGGSYTFDLTHNDVVRISIDGVEVHYGAYIHFGSFSVQLTSGHHDITIEYLEWDGDQGLEIEVSGPDTDSEVTNLFSSGILGDPADNPAVSAVFDDSLSGGAGNDTLDGGIGDDTLEGDGGDDLLVVGTGATYIDGGAGVDTADYSNATSNGTIRLDMYADDGSVVSTSNNWGFAANDVLINIENVIGSAFRETIVGNSRDNALWGGGGDDVIWALDGNDTVYGEDGNDQLQASNGNDFYDGGAGNDTLNGGNGADVLIGGHGDDALIGGSNDDEVIGGSGNDTLNGDGGFDTLEGGSGDDVLNGGSNWDVFVFADGFGQDTVTDFDVANDFEHIDLAGVTAINSFADLIANHASQVGGNTVIEDGNGNTITLTDVSLSALSASDFVF